MCTEQLRAVWPKLSKWIALLERDGVGEKITPKLKHRKKAQCADAEGRRRHL